MDGRTAYARRGDDVDLVTMPTFRAEFAEFAERPSSQAGGGEFRLHFTKPDHAVYARGHQGRLRFKLDYLQWQEQALRVSRRAGLDAADMGHHVSLGSMLLGTRLDELGPPFVFGYAVENTWDAKVSRVSRGHAELGRSWVTC
jgi:hypothetical protein